MSDLSFAVRAFWRTPAFTVVAVLTLALGIGATIAIFSVVNAVLLKPLPYAEPARLVVARLSLPDYHDLKGSVSAFEDMAVWATNLYNLRTGGESEQVLGGVISRNLLPLLGVEPLLGRNFSEDDEREDTVILGHGMWQSRFGADPGILGRSIDLSGTRYTVVGVAPAWFRFPSSEFELWTTIGSIETKAPEQAKNRGLRIFSGLARLRSGVTVRQAQAEVSAQSEALSRAYPETNAEVTVTFEPLNERLVGEARPGLRMLFVTVGFLLLIACANVANLMLARTTSRSRELAIRSALGAGRGRLVRQVLTESLVLAVAGGLLALLVAAWGIDALPTLLAQRVPRAEAIRLDATVALFAFGASLATALCFGVAPALQVAGGAGSALQESGRSVAGSARGRRTRHVIAVAEIALAVVVIAGASLLVRSFLALVHRTPGFAAGGLVSFNVQLVAYKDGEGRARAGQAVLQRLAALPGVIAAGASTGFPPVTAQRGTRFEVEGRSLLPEESSALFIAATPDYFRAAGTPVHRGRAIERSDVAGAPPVALINQALASALFPGEDPVGRRLRLVNREHSNEWRTIVGVVGDVRYQGLERDSVPAVYTSFSQTPFLWLYYVVRTEERHIAAAIRSAVASVDASLVAANVRPMEEVVAGTVAEPRFQMLLVSSFAMLALALAAVGIYGVIGYSVAQRTHEIGIRMALGAARTDVLALVMREGLVLAAGGVAIGLAAAALATRLMSALLVDIAPRDPVAFMAAAGSLLGVAALASYVPARRAVGLDPINALRRD